MHECEPAPSLLTPLPDPLCDPLLSAAVEKAQAAADRAEAAAKHPKYWLIVGFLFAFVGAVLAFALEENDPSVLGISLQPFGGVLFAAGALMIAGAGIASIGNTDGGPNVDGIKSVGGLIAVVVGITAVTTLTIVTLTKLGSKDSMVAVTSSAFGIISAVVGAYLGIKISSDNTANAGEEAQKAALAEAKKAVVAQHGEHITKRELEATRARADDFVTPEQAVEIKKARIEAGERARTTDPPAGGESA